MGKEGTEYRIKRTIVRTLNLDIEPDEIGDDDLLFGGDLGLHSMAAMEIIVGLEEEFSFEVSDDDLRIELLNSVRSMSEYIESTLSNSSDMPVKDP